MNLFTMIIQNFLTKKTNLKSVTIILKTAGIILLYFTRIMT